MKDKGYFGIGCLNMKRSMNYGTLFRTAQIFEADFIFLIGTRMKTQATDTMKSWRHIPTFVYIDFKDFNTDYPPGVMVYSAKEAEYKELVLRRDLMQLYPELATTMDADGMRNFQKHVFFPKFLQDPSLIDIMFPKTLDEIKAEGENEQLKEGMMPDVAETDNHLTHIYTHMMVQPKTWATWFHLDWHQKLLAEQKQQEMDAMKQQMATMASPTGGSSPQKAPVNQSAPKPAGSTEKSNPLNAASSLQTEIKSSNAQTYGK